jgi:hypothetical protein
MKNNTTVSVSPLTKVFLKGIKHFYKVDSIDKAIKRLAHESIISNFFESTEIQKKEVKKNGKKKDRRA